MSVLSSYRRMGRFRHLRRVRGRVARYRSLALGTATLIFVTLVIPLYFVGLILRSAGDVFDGAAQEIHKLVERFITDPYEKRLGPFSANAARYMEHIEGPECRILTTKSDLED